jgi:hypothetical protein
MFASLPVSLRTEIRIALPAISAGFANPTPAQRPQRAFAVLTHGKVTHKSVVEKPNNKKVSALAHLIPPLPDVFRVAKLLL